MTRAARLSGPASHFRPKDPRPVTVNLTTEGRRLLDQTAKRVHASRSDVLEYLLRRYGVRVSFGEDA